jgi:hypothetical protein
MIHSGKFPTVAIGENVLRKEIRSNLTATNKEQTEASNSPFTS